MPVTEVCRKMGISERTFYRWKERFQGMGVAEVRRLRPGFAAGGATSFVAAERALVAARALRVSGQVFSGVEGGPARVVTATTDLHCFPA
jgi:transposase-like protein